MLNNKLIAKKGHFEQQNPYEFAAAMESDTLNTFYVIAKGVPFDVCIEVKNRKPQWAEQIVANDEQDTCIDGENNDMGFFFNDELVELMDFCRKDSDCGSKCSKCSKCINNRCKYGFQNTNGTCYDCEESYIAINDITQEECGKCPNRMWTIYNRGRCVKRLTHEDNFWNGSSEKECSKFPNQYLAGETCFYCAGTVDWTTGACSTADCHRNNVSKIIYGLNENTCIQQCGGSFTLIIRGDKKVGRCTLP